MTGECSTREGPNPRSDPPLAVPTTHRHRAGWTCGRSRPGPSVPAPSCGARPSQGARDAGYRDAPTMRDGHANDFLATPEMTNGTGFRANRPTQQSPPPPAVGSPASSGPGRYLLDRGPTTAGDPGFPSRGRGTASFPRFPVSLPTMDMRALDSNQHRVGAAGNVQHETYRSLPARFGTTLWQRAPGSGEAVRGILAAMCWAVHHSPLRRVRCHPGRCDHVDVRGMRLLSTK
jgi:hypothetical protein